MTMPFDVRFLWMKLRMIKLTNIERNHDEVTSIHYKRNHQK